ncbi:MAG: type II toxin-antitoxin system RelE/ParE family toxin [candidate division NC10 bacterium]|nr:type II toxin-antitoxin system RelE/ParE family toxin [candidate division NC10 bacterium]
MQLRFTATGRTQFLNVIRCIKSDNPGAAVAFRNRVEKVLSRLERYPESGRRLPEFPDSRYREVIVAPYRFFYRTEKAVVWVAAVWHGAQLPREPGDGPHTSSIAGGV